MLLASAKILLHFFSKDIFFLGTVSVIAIL